MIGPAEVPTLDSEAAGRHPALAVLSLLAHRGEAVALDLGRAVLAACNTLDGAHATLYADLVLASLGEAARAALEAEMLKNYEIQSPFLRRILEEGVAQGVAQGELRGRVAALFAVLEARGFHLTPAQRTTIEACGDSDRLDEWLVQAATVDSIDEVLPG